LLVSPQSAKISRGETDDRKCVRLDTFAHHYNCHDVPLDFAQKVTCLIIDRVTVLTIVLVALVLLTIATLWKEKNF
jgi:hypothetical protein